VGPSGHVARRYPGTKKRRALCASFGRRRGCVPARGRSLDQNRRAGKGGLKITGKTGRRDNVGCSRPPRDEGHARAVVADIGGGAGGPQIPRPPPGGPPPPPLPPNPPTHHPRP